MTTTTKLMKSSFDSSGVVQPQGVGQKAPALQRFSHLSLPVRDMEEAILFYCVVMGGELIVETPLFSLVKLGGLDLGLGAEGYTFLGEDSEYPHQSFYCGADELIEWKEWLHSFAIPTSPIWTRFGIEALMFFRDPWDNVWELFCEKGFEGADALPRGPARGHGVTVDLTALRYDRWNVPPR